MINAEKHTTFDLKANSHVFILKRKFVCDSFHFYIQLRRLASDFFLPVFHGLKAVSIFDIMNKKATSFAVFNSTRTDVLTIKTKENENEKFVCSSDFSSFCANFY